MLVPNVRAPPVVVAVCRIIPDPTSCIYVEFVNQIWMDARAIITRKIASSDTSFALRFMMMMMRGVWMDHAGVRVGDSTPLRLVMGALVLWAWCCCFDPM